VRPAVWRQQCARTEGVTTAHVEDNFSCQPIREMRAMCVSKYAEGKRRGVPPASRREFESGMRVQPCGREEKVEVEGARNRQAQPAGVVRPCTAGKP